MTRDFYFRAWHPRHKKMVYFDFGDIVHGGDVLCPDVHGRYVSIVGSQVMQCTGLKDRNGKDIFEGDILATSNADPAHDLWTKEDMGYSAVRWSAELCRFVGSAWQWEGWKPSEEPESIYDLAFVEVIGNIYQSPAPAAGEGDAQP